MAYRTRIIEVGPAAPTFLREGMAITFGGTAPKELRSYCFILEEAVFRGNLTTGHTVRIGDQRWTITALGEIAAENLADLGHVSLIFDAAVQPRLPGSIHLGGVEETPALALGAELVFGDDQ